MTESDLLRCLLEMLFSVPQMLLILPFLQGGDTRATPTEVIHDVAVAVALPVRFARKGKRWVEDGAGEFARVLRGKQVRYIAL